ncbi:MAG TPA: hypothetical protein PKD73_16005 [Burkholderiaceae bacterium]|jgi:Ni/Co efflux regulator RcnB|nr:hypothetical protein [Burkholderiaceae bacterium]
MKKLISAIISAAVLAMPFAVISTSAEAKTKKVKKMKKSKAAKPAAAVKQ